MGLFKTLTDVVRMQQELERADARIKYLEAKLEAQVAPPSFCEVSRDFDASQLFGMVADKVVDDLAPFIQSNALSMLKSGFNSLERPGSGRAYGQVAYSPDARFYEVRFEIERCGTSVQVADWG